jgi:hypothetical protein
VTCATYERLGAGLVNEGRRSWLLADLDTDAYGDAEKETEAMLREWVALVESVVRGGNKDVDAVKARCSSCVRCYRLSPIGLRRCNATPSVHLRDSHTRSEEISALRRLRGDFPAVSDMIPHKKRGIKVLKPV